MQLCPSFHQERGQESDWICLHQQSNRSEAIQLQKLNPELLVTSVFHVLGELTMKLSGKEDGLVYWKLRGHAEEYQGSSDDSQTCM